MRAPSEQTGCLLTGILISVGTVSVLLFSGDYGWWTGFGLLALAVFGPQIVFAYWTDRQKRKDSGKNSD